MARQSQAPDAATILLTRPEPGASATAAALRMAGAKGAILCAPLMETQFLTPSLPQGAFFAVIFTSRAGVAAAVRLRDAGTSLPRRAFAVGGATAAAAQAAGFATRTAGGDAAALVALIKSAEPAGPLLHLRGRDGGNALQLGLAPAGLVTVEAIAYAQIAMPLSSAAAELLQRKGLVILPLFSPRSARLFLAATAETRLVARLDIVAMSAAVAEAGADIPAVHRQTSAEPSEAAMVHSVMNRLRQNRDLKAGGTGH